MSRRQRARRRPPPRRRWPPCMSLHAAAAKLRPDQALRTRLALPQAQEALKEHASPKGRVELRETAAAMDKQVC